MGHPCIFHCGEWCAPHGYSSIAISPLKGRLYPLFSLSLINLYISLHLLSFFVSIFIMFLFSFINSLQLHSTNVFNILPALLHHLTFCLNRKYINYINGELFKITVFISRLIFPHPVFIEISIRRLSCFLMLFTVVYDTSQT